jgi:hypothetical protein
MSKLFLSVLSLFATCSGKESAGLSFDSKEPLFISLGCDCSFAAYSEQIGYRRASFPFDWLLTLDHNGMVKILEDDFKYFLDPNSYQISPRKTLINDYYRIEFFHEHDNDFVGKYGRRIDRFRRLNNYPGKVFFVRRPFYGANSPNYCYPSKDLLNISFEHALELKQVLKKRFPILDFSLLIMNFNCNRTTIKITDEIIMLNASMKDTFDYLLKLVKSLSKYAEDPLSFNEEEEALFFDSS